MQIVSGNCIAYKGEWVSRSGSKPKIVKSNPEVGFHVIFEHLIYTSIDQFIVSLSKHIKEKQGLPYDIFIERKTLYIDLQKDLPSYSKNFESLYEKL